MIKLIKRSKILVFLVILINTFSLIASQIPNNYSETTKSASEFINDDFFRKLFNEDGTLSYDAVISFLEDLENERIETSSPQIIEKIELFVAYLAEQGIMPDTSDEEKEEILKDTDDLLNSNSDFVFANSNYLYNYLILPSTYYGQDYKVMQANWFTHNLKKIGKFIHKHKTAVIVATALVVATIAVVTTVVIASSAAAASAAATAAADSCKPKDDKKPETSSKIEPKTNLKSNPIDLLNPNLQDAFDKQFDNLKTTLIENNSPFTPDNNYINDNQRIIGAVLAHEALNTIQNIQNYNQDLIIQGHGKIDNTFSTYQPSFYTDGKKASNNPLICQSDILYYQGQEALKTKNYDLAIDNFGKAIEINPNNENIYLDRSYAYLEKGNFDKSLNDYNNYSLKKNYEQKPRNNFDKTNLCLVAATALSKGAIKSGKKTLFYAADILQDPIRAGKCFYTSVDNFENSLVNLINDCILQPINSAKEIYKEITDSNEWKQIRNAFIPELGDLIEKWDKLTLEEKIDKSCNIVGEFGGDILLPLAGAKLASDGIKGAKVLATIAKDFEKADKALVLEAFAGTGESTGFFLDTYKISANSIEKIKESTESLVLNNTQEMIFTKHALERAIERNVSKIEIFDALEHPLKIEEIKIDSLGRPSQRYIGKDAEVVINPETRQIVSVNPTSSKKADKLGALNDNN